MAPEWRRIEELFQVALNLPAPERVVFLARECRGDEELLREVESLLESSETDEGFIEQPAVTLGLKVLSCRRQLVSGQSIGHYRVVRLLGSGGMGDVYLADDCTLERQVALKFLVGGFGDGQWAKDQLMKEARAVAKLEHSNICGVHGIEEIDEDNFIVMQYVEGETLASLLLRETPSLDRALDFAEQTVSALAAAHLHGVVHRDVKPQNIVVTPQGRIKVLDFGLARFVRPDLGITIAAAGISETAQFGVVMGTVSYMSPEQILGEELDGRSDIFSFGIVLYEMLAGSNPFVRSSKEETLVAIRDQELSSLPQNVPEPLSSVVRRCLERDRTKRFASADELLIAIQAIRDKRRRIASGYFQTIRSHRHFSRYALAILLLLMCALVAAGVVYKKVTRVHTLAILPIINLSADPSLDYLSTGLTRNVYDKFSYLPRLKVRSPTEVPSNRTEDIVRAGRELNVEAVLSGEILKQGEALLLRIRVLDSADGTVRLEHTFTIELKNMIALQDEITRRVTTALGVWLIGGEQKLLSKRQTENQEALNAYMHGRHYWSLKRDEKNLKTAIKFFDLAVELDPAFAKAYSGRADCYVLMSNVLYGPLSPKEAREKAGYDARQALEIDPSLAEAHTSTASIKFRYDWDWQGAEKEFKLAIDLNPEYAPAHYWYSNLLAVMGRFDESISESEKGRSLDPYSPTSAMNYARALYYARRYDEAEGFLRKMLKEKPDYPQFLHPLGYVLLQRGLPYEAITTLETLSAKKPLLAAAALGYAYGKVGRTEEAKHMLRVLEQSPDPVPPHEKAIIYIGMNDLDRAFDFLQKSYDSRFASITFLTTDPLYDDLRSDPRFNELARRANLLP